MSRSPRFLTSKVVVARAVFRQPVSILWITSVRNPNQPVENRLVPLAPATGDGSGDTYYPDHHTGLGNDWKETGKRLKKSGWRTRRGAASGKPVESTTKLSVRKLGLDAHRILLTVTGTSQEPAAEPPPAVGYVRSRGSLLE